MSIIGSEMTRPTMNGYRHDPHAEVTLRPFPYPYRAMLAICSDLDETPDAAVYLEIMRFLNTTAETAMGRGVGLEVGNSIFFDMAPGQFAYWTTDDAGREMIRTLIRSGHIDVLHSYGDLAVERRHAARALDELSRHGCRLEVWVDHAVAPSNFGSDIMCGSGDVPGSPVYHADLTCDFGMKYVWRGRVTSMIGQDAPPGLRGLFSPAHPIGSTKTVAKEAAKHILARAGHDRYRMHGPNAVLRPVRLRDGRPAHEFLRSNPHWGGVSSCDTGREVGQVLTSRFLHRLEQRRAACVLYTHLGKIRDRRVPFDEAAVAAFRNLTGLMDEGRVLVTTTRRLLGFCRARREATWDVRHGEDGTSWIDIRTNPGGVERRSLDISDLDGLTFYVNQAERFGITVNGSRHPNVVRNAADDSGRPSVSLSWPRLEFPIP